MVTPKNISIDERFDDWQGVGPEFRDIICDRSVSPAFAAKVDGIE